MTQAAGDIERNRDDVTHLDALNMRANLDHLARILMTQLHFRGSRKAAVIDVQVAAAAIGRNYFQDHGMFDLSAFGILKRRIFSVLYLELVGT